MGVFATSDVDAQNKHRYDIACPCPPSKGCWNENIQECQTYLYNKTYALLNNNNNRCRASNNIDCEDGRSAFRVVGNTLQVKPHFGNSILNKEIKSIYKVRIRTMDQGGLSYYETFDVTLTDVNEPSTSAYFPSTKKDYNR